MATYISLCRFTQQGIENIKESPGRLDMLKEALPPEGASVQGFYLTMGQYDVVLIFDAKDEQTAARVGLALGALGNVRTETNRAFTEEEYRELIPHV